MGTKVGKNKEGKYISGFSESELYGLVQRGGKEKQKAITELTKRGFSAKDDSWPESV